MGVIASQFASLEQWELEDRLEDGNMIICAMGPGDFSAQGHFIVIYDYTSDGFCVNDPFSYTNSSKKMGIMQHFLLNGSKYGCMQCKTQDKRIQ